MTGRSPRGFYGSRSAAASLPSASYSSPESGLEAIGPNSNTSDNNAILSALGGITNQLSSVQSCLSTLTGKVEELSEKNDDLSTRVQTIEEEPPSKKKRKRLQVPPELSVSYLLKIRHF